MLHAQPRLLRGGVVVAIVAHSTELRGLNVAEVSSDELDSIERQDALCRSGPIGTIEVTEGDVAFRDGQNAAVANHAAVDVASEVFDGVRTRAEGLHVDAPFFAPDGRITGQAEGLHLRSEMMPEGLLQGIGRHEVVGRSDGHVPAFCIKSGCWNDAVQMRMEEHLLVPCVQDHRESAADCAQPLPVRQVPAQGGGAGVEEGVVGSFGILAEEQVPQLCRKRERNHEVGCRDELALLAPNPLGSGGTSALRTAFVVAAVKRVVSLSDAFPAAVHMPAHHGGPAVLQCPQGTVLHATEHGTGAQISGNESTQCLDDCGHSPCWTEVQLSRQVCAQFFHEPHGLLLAAVGEVEVDLGGVQIGVAEQVLHGMQTGTAFDQMRGEGMPQCVWCGIGEVELSAGEDEQTLQRVMRHGAGGGMHASGESSGRVVASTRIRKNQQRMPVEAVVVAQIPEHGSGQRDYPIFAALARADAKLMFAAENVVDGQIEALG